MDKGQGPLPFVIGVTGHRDLRSKDIVPLKKAVGEIIDEFRSRMPHTPLVVLSALAEGADRLVAMVALAKDVRVIVPLPMPQSIYEKDFDSSSLDEFRSLVGRIGADNAFELPLVEGSIKKDISSAGTKRDLQYAQLGQYIVLHSHLVIALWDGLDPNKLGGTADVVKMCLSEGRMEELASGSSWLNYEDECGPVYQVLTPRLGTYSSMPLNIMQLVMGLGMAPAQKKMIYPKGTDQTFKASWRNTERFNEDYLRRRPSIEQERTSSLKMFEATDSGELKRWADLTNVFVAADQLALQMKRDWEKTALVLYIFVVFSILCFAAVSNLGPLISADKEKWAKWMWGTFILFSFGAYLVWAVASWRQTHSRFLDYRGLAEALRIQFNWNVAGIHDVEVADCYLRHQIDKLNWIRTAARVCCIGRVDASPPNEEYRLRSVFDHWVKEQSEYYDHAAPKRDQKSRQLSRWALVWVLLGMGCAVLMLHNAIGTLSFGCYSGVIKMLMNAMFGITAVIVGYAGILAVEEESRQFGRMRTIYDRADKLRARFLPSRTGTTVDLPNARKIIRELGKEALEENGDWIVMHRARPLDIPMRKTEIRILKRSIGMVKTRVRAYKAHR